MTNIYLSDSDIKLLSSQMSLNATSIEDEIKLLNIEIAKISGAWIGEDATYFLERINSFMSELDNIKLAMNNYAKRINADSSSLKSTTDSYAALAATIGSEE